MGTDAEPRPVACCESLSSLPRVSRGTPNPAESRWKTNDWFDATPEWTRGLRFTGVTEGWPGRGGAVGRCGRCPEPPPPFPNATALFSPFHMPPGIHPQPEPEQ